MSELRFETYEMSAGGFGPLNPLPPLKSLGGGNFVYQINENVAKEDRKYLGYGLGQDCLPYRLQDNYHRNRTKQSFRVAVLENELIKATFLLDLGGRLWSLYHKTGKKELLYKNSVFQPANLAIRNAWFSGGIEWNVAVRGHATHTCSPIFAAKLTDSNNNPILRIYEYERVRGVPFQMDFYLMDDKPFLFVRTRIFNPYDHEIPMYWWSNAALPEDKNFRTIVPADEAFCFAYGNEMKMVGTPIKDNIDVTYATNTGTAADFFYRLPNKQRGWLALIDRKGYGLIQTSTDTLKGRKMFIWGMNPGGRRWQDFLAVPGEKYIELQTGLCRTQAECIPMPAGQEWGWLEAWGAIQTDGKIAHGKNWDTAKKEVETKLENVITREWLDEEHKRGLEWADKKPDEIIHKASGWGALERIRREKAGERPFNPSSLVYPDDTIGQDQKPWLTLLNEGQLPCKEPQENPGAWMVHKEWIELLEKAVENGKSDHWFAWMHLGMMYYNAEKVDEAVKAWEKSLGLEPSAWVYRNLAIVAKEKKNTKKAAELYLKAWEMKKDLLPLIIECCEVLIEADQAEKSVEILESLDAKTANVGRVKCIRAKAAFALNDLDTVDEILTNDFVMPDIREAEETLTDLWFGVREKRIAAKEGISIDEKLKERVREEFTPPRGIDFRMAVGTT